MLPIIVDEEKKVSNLQFAVSLMVGVGLALLVCIGLNAVEHGLSVMEVIPWPS